MDERLKNAFTKVINKHYSAVQVDTMLEHTDNWKLEEKSKLLWEGYYAASAEFKDLLEKCVVQ